MLYKQIIIVRTDLKMSPGKMAAQVAHASVSASENAQRCYDNWYTAWKREGQKKVVLKIGSEDELYEILRSVKEMGGIPYYIVNDAGLTELSPGTTTTLGLGPAPIEIIDKFTGHLKLL